MKPFDLEAAKRGEPVQTRDGRPVRIICFDRAGGYHIVALIKNGGTEDFYIYKEDGKYCSWCEDSLDLVMAPKKREGWMNLYKDFKENMMMLPVTSRMYPTKEDAKNDIAPLNDYIATIKIEWEE